MKPNIHKISVIIPAHNEEKNIGRCLNSVIKYLPNNSVEIIVVDNASTDRTSEISNKFQEVRVIHEPEKGSNRARQKGFVEAKGDLLAFVDADSMITKDWFNIVNERFSSDKKLVCLSGPYEYYDLPKSHQMLVKVCYITIFKPVFYLTRAIVFGGNFVVKKDALDKIGGFDVSINLFGDDMDLARRIKKVGKTLFLYKFTAYSSGRRLKKEGMIKTFFISYALNYFWVTLFHRPLTKNNRDIRE